MDLPRFRVHAIVLNDPGRLLAVHLMHTGLVSGWAGSMALYEVGAFDPNDIAFNPMWRQGMYVLPFMTRLGVVDSCPYGVWIVISLHEVPGLMKVWEQPTSFLRGYSLQHLFGIGYIAQVLCGMVAPTEEVECYTLDACDHSLKPPPLF